MNSIYLNVAGREGQGIVETDKVGPIVGKLRDELSSWREPDGNSVVQNVYSRDEAFEGPLSIFSPDILVGYSPGYRASQRTGIGSWEEVSLEPNQDHWGADHCLDPQVVPGVLF